MLSLVLLKKWFLYISRNFVASYSDRCWSEGEAPLSKPFSIGSVNLVAKLLKLPKIFGCTKSKTDHSSESAFWIGVPDKLSLIPLTLKFTRFLRSSVLMFLALWPSSTTTRSKRSSERLILSPVTIPYDVTRIPPCFFINLIYCNRSAFFLSSNYMTLSTSEHHFNNSVCQ